MAERKKIVVVKRKKREREGTGSGRGTGSSLEEGEEEPDVMKEREGTISGGEEESGTGRS